MINDNDSNETNSNDLYEDCNVENVGCIYIYDNI